MAESLLAHLYTRIKGSQEDVATMALHFILSSSEKLNEAYNKLLSDVLGIGIDLDTIYSCQSVGENSERPDMSGVDRSGKEIVLCEMKFYAGLTSNQPNGYLDRLIKENGRGLVFICPKSRQISLWSKIKELCINAGRILDGENGYRVSADGMAMGLITWGEVIEVLRRVASAEVYEALSDIEQLSGFCNMMDQNAFIPFSDEELGPETARREDRYYQVVDSLVNKIASAKEVETSLKGVRATPFWSGYSRAVSINGYWCVISYERRLWENSLAEVPFWVAIRDSEWKQPESFNVLFDKIPNKDKYALDGFTWIALPLLTNVPLDDIVNEMFETILEYIKML